VFDNLLEQKTLNTYRILAIEFKNLPEDKLWRYSLALNTGIISCSSVE
jgi:hypothetical protein